MINFTFFSKQIPRKILYFRVFVWAMLIFVLSSQPVLPGPQLFAFDFLLKKSAHIIVYGILFIFILQALEKDIKNPLKASFLAFVLTFIYAARDEFHQSLVPGRTGTFRDLGYDSLGMAIAWLAYYKYI